MKNSVLATLVLAALLAISSAACAHMSDLQTARAKGRGTTLAYAVSLDQAWQISERILHDAGAETIDEHRDKGYMLASTSVGEGISVGTYIGVWLESEGGGQTKVTVITKRKIQVEVITALTEDGFHRKFMEALGSQGPISGTSAAATQAAASPSAPASPAAPPLASGSSAKDRCVEAHTKAQSARRDGKFRAAREELTVCVDAGCPSMVRDDCIQRLDELERVQPTIVFDAKDGTGSDLTAVRVSVDGKLLIGRLDGSALQVEPGPHTFLFEVTGQPSVSRTFVLKEGEKARRERVVIGPK
jgi:hypothetical protein